ncbi:MAG: AAA family ATPase, partial [Clostridia bacterium]|nr:AAA family ATPase [Clostridia bacterium]
MGRYLNPGDKLLRDQLRDRFYVDKSGLIACLNDYVSVDKKKFVCVSRPRRFGKSYAADMLMAYYGRGCDSHSLFDGLDVSKSPDYDT